MRYKTKIEFILIFKPKCDVKSKQSELAQKSVSLRGVLHGNVQKELGKDIEQVHDNHSHAWGEITIGITEKTTSIPHRLFRLVF